MNNEDGKSKRIQLKDLSLPQDLKSLEIPQCKSICREVRNILISTVSKTGGHLASNLGAVELTLALHRNFSSPDDKIIWDVGHQTYTHKILTGRMDKFSTLRQENGISGFPKPEESEHDIFISGHSSTSISVACGISKAMELQGKDNYTVAVIGDGALTGGMAYEGLNNAGKSNNKNLIVILNDNEMSISKNVGSLAKYLTSLRGKEKYLHTKRAVEKTLINIPVVGMPVARGIKNSKDVFKERLLNNTQCTMFEDMGFIYLGPVDGHDIEALDEVLRTAKSYKSPVLVHVSTIKGKGYPPAEKNPGEYHGISRFDIVTGNPEVSSENSYSAVFGKELAELAGQDEKICAVTAAMKYGTGLQYFCEKYRERFFDVGIAEEHAVTFSAGLASMGFIPVFAVYSTFLQRAYDQLIHDASISGVHIVLGIDRAGIVGEDGETHQGMFDVPMLMSVPNTVIYSPSCYEELKMCLHQAIYKEKNITAVRYPRGCDKTVFNKSNLNLSYTFTDSENSDILLVSYGRIYDEVYKAQSILNGDGISCSLLKLTKIFPLSGEIVEKASEYSKIIFFEESYGGISLLFGDLLLEKGYKGEYLKINADGFIKQASVRSCLDKIGLTCEKIVEQVRKRSFEE
ncbi:MAG: 1-deoxy-D-xylulose-5-phosphate synthase [Oscillospiraceae bacterium]|nr:1-deoxy-D-xylulose-5-phosphate synthase [Oscillospiraceae bacterium]